MALEDMMGLLTIAPIILKELPLIMFLLYISFIVSFSLFLGFIAMRGIRERWYMNYWMKFGLRIGTGLLCFVIGLSKDTTCRTVKLATTKLSKSKFNCTSAINSPTN